MKLALIFLGMILGLSYGHYDYGFLFSSDICLFAGITLIMPTLFNVKLKDITLLYTHKTIMIKGLLINYIILPIIALCIGLLTENFGIAAGLFLLSVLSGGGMVMHWIKTANADTSLGFVLLLVNLIFVSFSLLMLHIFGIYTSDYFGESYLDGLNMSNFAQAVIILLIVIPFLVSRVIIFIKPLKKFIEDKKSYISNISIFLIIFYLFGLNKSQALFEIYDFEPELIYISFAAVVFFYLIIYIVSKKLYDTTSPQERAAFWHTVTRYITLALVISTFSISTFGTSMLLPIMFAYIIQIPFSAQISQLQKKELDNEIHVTV
jgi:arsenite transporter